MILQRLTPRARTSWFADYVSLVVMRDVLDIARVRQREALPRLLRQLAAQTGQMLNISRLVLQLPGSGEELEMDLLKEALEPRWVTVQVTPAASVRAVSLEDTVGLKARAWHDPYRLCRGRDRAPVRC